jgi:hypothetical protein
MATATKFDLPIPICMAYLVPLDVDVTGNITAKIGEVWKHLLHLGCHGNKKGDLICFRFLSSNFIKLCRNIHRSVRQLLVVEAFSKWRPLPW